MAESRRSRTSARPEPASTLLRAAAVSYLASCALGTAVARGRLVTGRARWVHHALYVSTATLTGLACGTAALAGRRSAGWLPPALLPLAVIPFAGTHSSRHVVLALAAGPCYAAAWAADRS